MIINSIIPVLILLAAIVSGKMFKQHELSHFLLIILILKLLFPAIYYLPVPSLMMGTNINRAAEYPIIVNSNSINLFRILVFVISFLIAIISIFKTLRFNKMISDRSELAGKRIYTAAEEIAGRFGIKKVPEIHIVRHNIMPLVLDYGTGIKVCLPNRYTQSYDYKELYLVLAHEMAHIKRKDYLVRWLELIAIILLWWSPLLWIGRYFLHQEEEICCDRYVINYLNADRTSYAKALLSEIRKYSIGTMIEIPGITRISYRNENLKRRIKMIMTDKSSVRFQNWHKLAIVILAAVIIPLGFSCTHSVDSSKAAGQFNSYHIDVSEEDNGLEKVSVTIDSVRVNDVLNAVDKLEKIVTRLFPEKNDELNFHYELDNEESEKGSLKITLK